MSHQKASKRMLRTAGKTLGRKGATKLQKSLAGSVLANAPHKKRKSAKKRS